MSFFSLFMLLTSHDLEELALAPVAEAGEDAGSNGDDGTAFLLDLTQDVDTEFLDLILVDVDVHAEPPFVKGLMGQEILHALRYLELRLHATRHLAWYLQHHL